MATRHENPIYKTVLGVIGLNLAIGLIIGSISSYRAMAISREAVLISAGIFIVGILLAIFSVKEIIKGHEIVKGLQTQNALLKKYIIEKQQEE